MSDKRFSFEFFPPKTDAGREKLHTTREQLSQLNPEFFSVTYGAGGSTRDNTKDIVINLKQQGIDVAPHLSFGGDDESAILQLLHDYKEAGVKRVVALRGDIPSGIGGAMQLVYANELTAFIRQHFGRHFEIEVAAYPEIHPEAPSYQEDIQYLKGKFDAGADSAISQYFFNADAYFHFVDACQKIGIDKPLYPGIMPIINFRNLIRFSDSCGAEIPRWIRQRIEGYGNDQDSIIAFGIEVVSELCEKLLAGGAPGFHFYTMNQVEPTRQIYLNTCEKYVK